MLLSQWLGILILAVMFVVAYWYLGKHLGYGALTIGILVAMVFVVLLVVGIALALGVPIVPV